MTRGNADTGKALVKVFLVAEGSIPQPGGEADFTLPATSETQALLGLSDRLRYSPIAPTFGEPSVLDGLREPSRVETGRAAVGLPGRVLRTQQVDRRNDAHQGTPRGGVDSFAFHVAGSDCSGP